MTKILLSVFLVLGTWMGSLSEAQAQTTAPLTYKVKAGDNLFRIAQRYGVEVADLMTWNDLNSDLIKVGQELKVSDSQTGRGLGQRTDSDPAFEIPGYQQARLAGEPYEQSHLRDLFDISTPANPAARTSNGVTPYYEGEAGTGMRSQAQPERVYHQVKRGENLNQIALQYGVSAAELRTQNRLFEVIEGQTIVINLPKESVFNPDYPNGDANARFAGIGTNAPQTSRSDNGLNPTSNQSVLGTYEKYERDDVPELYYAAHKTLPPGSKLKIRLPEGHGEIELTVVGVLSQSSRALLGVSPAVVTLINGTGQTRMVEVFY